MTYVRTICVYRHASGLSKINRPYLPTFCKNMLFPAGLRQHACGRRATFVDYVPEFTPDASFRALMATDAILSMSLFLRAYITNKASAGWNSGKTLCFSVWQSTDFCRSTKKAFVLLTTIQNSSLYCVWVCITMRERVHKMYTFQSTGVNTYK